MRNPLRAITTLSFVLAFANVAPLAQGQTASPSVKPATSPTDTLPADEAQPTQAPKPCGDAEPCPQPLPDSSEVPVTSPAPSEPPTYPPTPYYPQPAPAEVEGTVPVTDAQLYAAGPVISGRPARLNSPGAREHEGFFLRLALGAGAGFARYRESVDGQRTETVQTGGLAGQLEIAVGGRVVGNLIVHGNLLVGGVGDANKTVSGVKDASNKIGGSLGLIGGGVTYYFMPYNAYVSGMIGAGSMDETRDDQLSVESGPGLGGSLMPGKEWWVGQRAEWGMGAALRGTMLSAPVQIAGIESRLLASQVTIAVSVTLN